MLYWLILLLSKVFLIENSFDLKKNHHRKDISAENIDFSLKN